MPDWSIGRVPPSRMKEVVMNRFRFVLLFAAVLLAVTSLSAQVASSVTGTVVDPSGAAVPGATVSLQLAGSGSSVFTTKTSANGALDIASVPPNTYDIVVELRGFSKLVVDKLVVEPSRVTDVQTLKLAIAGGSEE